MQTLPKTTGETIASNLHGCQIICERDVERVAKQINKGQAPLIKALERAEECLTRLRNQNVHLWEGKCDEVSGCLRDVRLALHDESQQVFQP